MIGIAFSCGFLLGPVIGAGFSVWGKRVAESGGDPYTVFRYPALFALGLALLDIALLVSVFPETLPVEKRARSLGQGVLSTLYLINPLSLFRFDALSKITDRGSHHSLSRGGGGACYSCTVIWPRGGFFLVWFPSVWFPCSDVRSLRRLGLGYFLYLFLFSGLEYSLTFLTHQRFKYTR